MIPIKYFPDIAQLAIVLILTLGNIAGSVAKHFATREVLKSDGVRVFRGQSSFQIVELMLRYHI